MSFQVDQDTGRVESDLESPGFSYEPEIFRSVGSVCIRFGLWLELLVLSN